MLIEELKGQLPGAQAPAFDARRHAEVYRALPRERRRIVNAVYRAGGVKAISQFGPETPWTPHDLRALQEAELLYALPSSENPEQVVLPLEMLFATPLQETDPDSLVEALKIYPKTALWSIASARGVSVDGANEYLLRARLYRHSASGAAFKGMGPAGLGPLKRLREHGWTMDYGKLLRELGIRIGVLPAPIEGLFASLRGAQNGLEDLFLRLVVVPVRSAPGSSSFRSVAVTRDFRAQVDELLRTHEPPPAPAKTVSPPVVVKPSSPPMIAQSSAQKAETSRPAKPAESGCRLGLASSFNSREGTLRGEMMRLLLLVEQDPPSITRMGTVNRTNLARMSRHAGIAKTDLESACNLAIRLGLLEIRDEVATPAPSAGAFLGRNAAEFARALAKLFGSLVAMPSGPYWIDQARMRKLSDAARKAVLETLVAPGAVTCIHCLAGRLAALGDFRKADAYGRSSKGDLAEKVLEVMASSLHELGLAEAAREKDRIVALRWTATAAMAFGKEPVQAPSPADSFIVVQPSGEIIAPGGMPFDDLRMIARAAEVRSVDAAAIFALTRASLLRSAQRGDDPAKLKEFLTSRCRNPLPQPVAFLLDELATRMGEIEIVFCSAVVKVRDPLLLKSFGESLVPISDRAAALLPTSNPSFFLNQLRKQGYLLRVADRSSPRPDAQSVIPPNAGREEEEVEEEDSPPDDELFKEATARDGIERRLHQALEHGDYVEIAVRGGRRHAITIDLLNGDTVQAWDVRSGRNVVVSLESIVSARLVIQV